MVTFAIYRNYFTLPIQSNPKINFSIGQILRSNNLFTWAGAKCCEISRTHSWGRKPKALAKLGNFDF